MGSELLVIVGWLELVYFKIFVPIWFRCFDFDVGGEKVLNRFLNEISKCSLAFLLILRVSLGFPGCKMFVCFVTIYHESSSQLAVVDLSLLNFVMVCWHSIIIGGGLPYVCQLGCMKMSWYTNMLTQSVPLVAAHCSVRNWECLQIHFYYGCLWQMLTVWRYESQLV